jgi:hypothetical protein
MAHIRAVVGDGRYLLISRALRRPLAKPKGGKN